MISSGPGTGSDSARIAPRVIAGRRSRLPRVSRLFQGSTQGRASSDPFSGPRFGVRSAAIPGEQEINLEGFAPWRIGTASQYFLAPQQTSHRRYEALRAVFVAGDRCRRRPAVRVQGLGAEVDGLPLPCRVPARRHSPLFLPDGRGRYPRPCEAMTDTGRNYPRSPTAGSWPHPGANAPHARGGRLPLPAPAGPSWASTAWSRRRAIPARRWSPPPRRAVAADAEAPRQGATQPHRRLQLRRGPRPVRRAEHPAQEVVRHRLLLPHRPRPAAGPAAGWVKALAPVLFPDA